MSYRGAIGSVLIIMAITLSALWAFPKANGDEALVRARGRAQTTTLTRDQIKQMPILQRPNRLGHFYGNTVRRRYYRSHSG